jgi:hypothetical protein
MNKKDSHFRSWVRNLWYENRDEHNFFNQQGYSLEEYFNRYKYWLKREYQYQQRQQKNES